MASIIKGMPGLVYGADYNPEQWLTQKETIWKQDMAYAKEAGVNSLSIGIFSWSYLEPEDGVYDFSWMDEVMDMLAENGIKAILATPSGSRPPWLAEKYPSVLRMNHERLRHVYGGRHNACFSSPDFRRKVHEINTRLAERYKDHPALGAWHVSNEYNSSCHCPLCQQAFQQWLKAHYQTIEALNAAWWNSFWSHRFTSFDQIQSPTTPSYLGERESTGHNLAWRRFCSDLVVDFFAFEAEPLRKHTPHTPVTSNMMETFPGIDYFQLGAKMDFTCWDNYPQWKGDERDEQAAYRTAFNHDLIRGAGGQKPFFMMESCPSSVNWHAINGLRAPGTLLFQSLQAVAHGSDSVQYFQFRKGRGGSEQHHGAVIDHVGHGNTRVFREVAQVGQALASLAPVAGSITKNKVALVFDWVNRWALQDAWMLHRENQQYEETILAHHTALLGSGVGVDMVDQLCDLSPYRLVCAPMCYLLRQGFAERAKAFVRGGGTLLLTYVSGYVNEDALCFLGGFPGPLREVAGIWMEEADALDGQRSNGLVWQGNQYAIHDICERIHAETAEPLATYEHDFYKGEPVLTRNAYGKGRCYYLAARTDAAFLKDFYPQILAEASIAPIIKRLPSGVTATERFTDGARYVFLLNARQEEARLPLDEPMSDAQSGALCEKEALVPPMSVRVLHAQR